MPSVAVFKFHMTWYYSPAIIITCTLFLYNGFITENLAIYGKAEEKSL
jgi:hypothetical protein